MPNIFDEASRATEEMFDQPAPPEAPEEQIPEDTQSTEDVPADTPVSVPAEDPVVAPDTPDIARDAVGEAAQTAEIAAQVAAAKDAELQQMKQELDAERLRSAQLQGTVAELSRQNEEAIVEEALAPPELDVASLAFADADTVKAAQAKYAQELAEYNRKTFLKEFAPVIEQANEAKHAKEKGDVISALSQIDELKGIADMVPRLDRIIANNAALASDSIPLDEKYITAYAIAMGVNAMNTPPVEPTEPTTEELLDMYNKNPELQAMIEKQRIAQVKQSQQVPPFSASSGAVNAALDIKEEPKGWDEASDRTKKMFGAG